MLSFHNDPKIKDKYLDRVRKNGGAVGCTLEHKDNKRYPIELGLPVWLARLEEEIFNNLPVDKAKQWPLNFLKAIPIGVDVDAARHLVDIRRMDRLIIIQEKLLSKNEGAVKSAIVATISAIKIIKSCHDAALNKRGFDVTFEEAKAAAVVAAWAAAESAAAESAAAESEAAESASWAAAWAAAESAAAAAWAADAKAAAESAASAAEAAAWAADAKAAWEQEANDLLEILSSLKGV